MGMNQVRVESRKDKISPQFAERLDRLEPHQKVGAIVIMNGAARNSKAAATRRGSRATRRIATDQKRKALLQMLPQIDRILERFGGHRLSKTPDALGSIPVETTPAGIKALAESKHVKVILENQRIALVR